ncbi:hypothetical protein ACB092_11G181900 [Castanea dentata]
MSPIVFYALCKILSENNLLQEPIHMSIKEQLLIFLHIIGHDVRSIETMHRYFRHVLRAVLQLYKHMIREPDKDTPLEIRNSSRFKFSDNPPSNDKELFNLRHSSLRTSIERCFGVLKKRVDPLDSIMSNELRGSPLANDSTSRRVQQSQREVQEENREWVQKRDDICRKMWEDYNAMEIAMGNTKDTQKVKDTKTNFRWSQPMQNLLLEILADEARHGNKQSNTFKHASYAKHVEHLFKTLKTNWNTIALLRNKKSRFGWNDDLKMITCDRTVYDEEVAAHSNHAQFLNKKIEMFDEMALVVGKDMATGGFSKGVGDIGVEALDDSPPLVDADVDDISKKKQVDPSHVASNETRSHRKRSHATMIEDAVYQDLSIQLGKVASAIEKISENQLNFVSLYEEVMKMDGFEENMLAAAFDHLNGDEKQARSFMLKNDKLRRQWLQNFFDNYLSQF